MARLRSAALALAACTGSLASHIAYRAVTKLLEGGASDKVLEGEHDVFSAATSSTRVRMATGSVESPLTINSKALRVFGMEARPAIW